MSNGQTLRVTTHAPRHPLDKLDVHDLSALRTIITDVLRDYQTVSLKDASMRCGLVEEIEQRIIATAAPSTQGGEQ